MVQRTIFDETNEAINRSYTGATIHWLVKAEHVIIELAKTKLPFTTDAVWHKLGEHNTTREPRALGGVMRKLANDKVIITTGNYQKSVRKECHRRPLAVWVGV